MRRSLWLSRSPVCPTSSSGLTHGRGGRSRRWVTPLLTSVASLLPAAAQAALCPAQLAPRIEAALNAAPLDTAYVGMVLQTQSASPQERRTLYSRNDDRLFTPASNVKLLTTAAALHRLGPSYRLRTTVHGTVGPDGLAALRVVGRGDPTMTNTQLSDLAQQLRQAGVSQVSRLVLDDSHFPGYATNPTWEWEDSQFFFAVPVNGLIFNQNAVAVQVAPTQVGQPLQVSGLEALPAGPWPMANHSLTVAADPAQSLSLQRRGDGPTLRITGQMAQADAPRRLTLAVFNPAEQFAAAFRTALIQQGISVAQVDITPMPAPALGPEMAAASSPPLSELLLAANQDSDNLYAEVLLKTLGVEGAAPPTDASRAGAAAIQRILAELGLPTEALRIADGSGLSRHNLVSPAALAETLQQMAVHPQASVFRESLAVAGVSGTLRNRLVDTPLSGRVQGKTGALTGNVALSAYIQPPNYEPLVVSILINHSNQHASQLRARIDEILLLIGQLREEC